MKKSYLKKLLCFMVTASLLTANAAAFASEETVSQTAVEETQQEISEEETEDSETETDDSETSTEESAKEEENSTADEQSTEGADTETESEKDSSSETSEETDIPEAEVPEAADAEGTETLTPTPIASEVPENNTEETAEASETPDALGIAELYVGLTYSIDFVNELITVTAPDDLPDHLLSESQFFFSSDGYTYVSRTGERTYTKSLNDDMFLSWTGRETLNYDLVMGSQGADGETEAYTETIQLSIPPRPEFSGNASEANVQIEAQTTDSVTFSCSDGYEVVLKYKNKEIRSFGTNYFSGLEGGTVYEIYVCNAAAGDSFASKAVPIDMTYTTDPFEFVFDTSTPKVGDTITLIPKIGEIPAEEVEFEWYRSSEISKAEPFQSGADKTSYTITETDLGEYFIVYMNHTKSELSISNVTEAAVAKGKNAPNMPTEEERRIIAEKDDLILSDIMLPERWAWEDCSLSLIPGGIVKADALFDNQDAYENFKVEIQVAKYAELVPDATDEYYYIGKDTEAVIKTTGDCSNLREVLVDESRVDWAYLTVESGSTILTLKQEYLDTLSEGDHEVELKYTAGSVKSTLTVVQESVIPVPNGSAAAKPTETPQATPTVTAQATPTATVAASNTGTTVTATPTPAAQTATTNAPKTADESPVAFYLLLLAGAVVLISMVSLRKRSQK